MTLSNSELSRFKALRIVGVADILFMLAFLNGVLTAYLLLRDLMWQGLISLALMPLFVALFQYNVRNYFREANGK